MSSVSGIRLPGLATGMDTDNMIKEMLAGEQGKVDKAKQKEQTIKWQQEIYREIINEFKGFNEKYFSLSSPNSILNSSSWNTLSVNSSDSNIVTATGNAGANNVDYTFEIDKLSEPAKVTSTKVIANGGETKLKDLGFNGEPEFTIKIDGKELGTIKVSPEDTITTLVKNINDATDGKVKASYSDMTKSFSIESAKTGSLSSFEIVDKNGKNPLHFLDLQTKEYELDSNGNFVMDGEKPKVTKKVLTETDTTVKGSKSLITVSSKDGFSRVLSEESNSFTIDGIKYNVNSIGKADITSKQDVKPVVDNMKAFVEDYNKMMDKMYNILTQKTNKDYPPLTEAQKEDMSEEEIERWEKKSKEGILRNDSDMRKFMDEMQKSIFGDKMGLLSEFGFTSHENYNKRGQLALDEKKFTEALQKDGKKVYEIFAESNKSVLENMKTTINRYVGSSTSIFAKKAGLANTSSAANNFYSEQLKKQEENIKKIQKKMKEKEDQLYKKFANLESSMNKLNSQMAQFMQY